MQNLINMLSKMFNEKTFFYLALMFFLIHLFANKYIPLEITIFLGGAGILWLLPHLLKEAFDELRFKNLHDAARKKKSLKRTGIFLSTCIAILCITIVTPLPQYIDIILLLFVIISMIAYVLLNLFFESKYIKSESEKLIITKWRIM